MRIIRKIWAYGKSHRAKMALQQTLSISPDAGFSGWPWESSLKDPTAYYLEATRAFYKNLPEYLCEHRSYFRTGRRGFGEDAFHVMWEMIFQRLQPVKFLEIGVFRGQTLTLAALLQKELGIQGKIVGISPFQDAGDRVSQYPSDIDYLEDTLKNFAHFHLPAPTLIKAFSTDAGAVEVIRGEAWDVIYIDGNHDYEVAIQDWDHCAAAIKTGGLIVLDDAGLTSPYQPPPFATGGHPGPSKIAAEIDRNQFREVLQVGHNRVFQKL